MTKTPSESSKIIVTVYVVQFIFSCYEITKKKKCYTEQHRLQLLIIYQSFIFPEAKASGLLKSP